MNRSITLFIFLLLSVLVYSQPDRVALVIGNSNYSNGVALANPVNDATDITEKLKACGFYVETFLDLKQVEMKKAIDDFGPKMNEAEVSLFFYAGHGIQARGSNYLIPIDASLKTENDVEYNCVDAGRILGKMEDAGTRTNIIILDACRDNPFERSWSRKSTGAGLAFMNAPSGSFIAYSTAPGKTASDGYYRNSPFTAGVLEHINTPNLKIEDLFKLVRAKVRVNSNGAQTPWDASSLEGDFYFNYNQGEEPNKLSTQTKQISVGGNASNREKIDLERSNDDYEAKRKTLARGIRSIAVMPFTDYTGDENNIYLAAGMHDALIGELGRLGQLRVTSRNSTLSYSDLSKTISEIATELNVEGVVETSVIAMDDKIRIQIKLYCAVPEEELLWSQVFDSDKDDVYGLYDRVIRNITNEIELTLSYEQGFELRQSEKINPDAYEAYVIGKHYLSLFTPNELKMSIQYFEKALKIDKDFALAYLGMSDAWYAIYQLGVYSPTDPEPMKKMYVALTNALALNDKLEQVHYTLGSLKATVEWDFEGALAEYDKAQAINPNYADLYSARSNLLAIMGRIDEAVNDANMAISLDPQNLFTKFLYGATMVFARRYDDAISTFTEILLLDPDNFLSLQMIPFAYHMKGEYNEELNCWRSFLEAHYDNEQVDLNQIIKPVKSKRHYKKTMVKLADKLLEQLDTKYFDIFIIGMYYSMAEENDKALDMLERALREHNPNSQFLVNPIFDNLRSEPRFIEINKKMNLPHY